MRARIVFVSAALVLFLVGLGVATRPSPQTAAHQDAAVTLPHIMVIMEENQGYAATQTGCGTNNSYFCSLASKYTSSDAWYGVSHPSQPNYTAFASGSTQGCTSDGCVGAGAYSVEDLGGQLTAKGIPWTAYMESMPSACYTGSSSGEYVLKHNPFALFSDNLPPNACNILPYPGATSMVSTLDGASAPDFVWITPNLIDDMHDGTVADGNTWLENNLAPVLTSTWFTGFNSTVIVTEDENDSSPSGSCCGDAAGGQIPMIVISSNAVGGGTTSIIGDHYGTLRTIEEAYGLSLLGGASNSANGDLTSLFGNSGLPTPTPHPHPPLRRRLPRLRPHPDTHSHADGNPHTDANTYRHTHPDGNPDTHTHTHANTNSHSHADGYPDCDANFRPSTLLDDREALTGRHLPPRPRRHRDCRRSQGLCQLDTQRVCRITNPAERYGGG